MFGLEPSLPAKKALNIFKENNCSKIVELGAGVGTTGIIVAGLCKTKSVHMTDYTDATLLNMIHNVAINKEWTKRVRESLNVEEENAAGVGRA